MSRVFGFVVVLCVVSGCQRINETKVWRDTWEPVGSEASTGPRLVTVALQTSADQMEELARAGGRLIGYHRTQKGYALRAASTGGTHFVPVEATSKAHAQCRTSSSLGLTSCVASNRVRWTRIAVIRVEPDHWRRLPAALVPLEDEYSLRQPDAVVRTGCRIQRSWGHTKCDNDWEVASAHDVRRQNM